MAKTQRHANERGIRRCLGAIAVPCAVFLAQCESPSAPQPAPGRAPSPVIATVDGSPIMAHELMAALLRTRGRARNDAATRALVLEELIFERALQVSARRTGVTVPEEAVDAAILLMRRGQRDDTFDSALLAMRLTEEDLRERVRERLVGEELLRRAVATAGNVSDAEVADRWKTWPDRALPERARVSQIVVRTEELATALRKELAAKDGLPKFQALARKHSLGPERRLGGQLGLIERGRGPKVFQAVFDQKVGQVSQVVPSDYGFHIFLVEEKLPPREAKLDDARRAIVATIRDEKLRARETEWRRGLLASLRVERHTNALEAIK